jgi:hypothetical protein
MSLFLSAILISDGKYTFQYIMAPSSVHRSATRIPGTVNEKKAEKKAKSPVRKKGLFGLLKGWTIDSQAISDELKD